MLDLINRDFGQHEVVDNCVVAWAKSLAAVELESRSLRPELARVTPCATIATTGSWACCNEAIVVEWYNDVRNLFNERHAAAT